MIKFIKNILNRITFLQAILIYLFLSILLILFYTKQANYNINLLIHLNESFLNYNPEMEFKNLLVLKTEGYDGQFYYFISRYIFDSNIHDLTLDSTSFRMLRIGSSILYGLIPAVIGWEYYAYWVLFFHHMLFLFSYFLFYKILDEDIKYLSIIYLMNPYVIISNMLLIGDTVFISLFMMFVYLLIKIHFNFDFKTKIAMNTNYWIALFLAIYIAITKETSLFYFIPLWIIFLLKKDIKGLALISIPVIILLIWYILIHYYFNFQDLNPISHSNRIRIPFVDMFLFYKNHLLSNPSILNLIKSLPYFIILIMYISLLFIGINVIKSSLQTRNIFYKIKDIITFIPVGIIIIIIAIVDLEYWLAFDNIFRIFSFAFLWLLFLNLKDNNYKFYGFYIFNLIISLLLIFRYLLLKKVGLYTIL